MSQLRVRPSHALSGQVTVPGDKSIAHRALILGALARGQTPVTGFLVAEDTLHTAQALCAMGVIIEGLGSSQLVVHGAGLRGLRQPESPLDLGNSGTGMRLLLGALAGQPLTATLIGDESLSRRPMDRVAEPLGQMGIEVTGQGPRCTPPVTIRGGHPRPIRYESPVASAQVKSAVLLAGLYAQGVTTVIEPAPSRDHTERMLRAFGAQVCVGERWVSVEGEPDLCGVPVRVPGDFSSAAYFLGAGLLGGGNTVTVRNVLLNPTRAALLDVFQRMGGSVVITDERQEAGERVGNVTTSSSALQACCVAGSEIPSLIDELPLLAVVATQAQGTTKIRDAEELRVKESDRLAVMAEGLRAMGARVQELPDGLIISGPTPLKGATIASHGDHRIAMSFAVAGLFADGDTVITGAESIATSYPDFVRDMTAIGAQMEMVNS